ncbi:hypothetical protein F7Q92_15320 [Ideonella dechloratans]|uniref:Uncharacterized protein n=1 Tax=Ideonella dechloratans TaxID=36863 RepID=A0A643FCR4_IDEDE|nr:hypothetical protein [Ideonella dechloratans]KAB0579052.1 hypothetical protein F7Q92_15320 [Ideonella dechloratans]UFU10477.1 hypothetical protein LRM40_01790 [Ideonella dechloratans]
MAAVTLGSIVDSGYALVCVPLVCVVVNVVAVHAMVRVADFGRDFIRLSRFCTKHGRGHRTPEGEQHANKQQNEDAKKSH